MPFTALPADRPRAEAGVRAAYTAAGLTPPACLLWVPSPAAGALLSVLLRPGLSPAVRSALCASPALSPLLPGITAALRSGRSSLADAAGERPTAEPDAAPVGEDPVPGNARTSRPHSEEGGPDADAPAGSAGEAPQPHTDAERGGLLRRVLRAGSAPKDGPAPRTELDELLAGLSPGLCVRERVRTAPWERERAAAHAELGPRGWAGAWARTGALTWERVNELVTRIRRAIGELGGAEHGPLLRAATLDAVLGQHDAPWLELFASLDRLSPLHGLAETAASAGWWWPYENLVILTERPAELHRDNPGRLHRGDGPALAYPDGFALHAWRGMPIPPGFLDTLSGLTAARILAEDNAELRRVMLEHFGYDRYLAEAGARPLHQDETGTLWRIDLPGDEPVAMVEVLNSTPEPDGSRRTYYLRVPPDTPTARAGVAWTFGLTEAEYRPLQET